MGGDDETDPTQSRPPNAGNRTWTRSPSSIVINGANSSTISASVFAILGEKSNDVLKKAPIAGLFATDVGETEPKTDRTEMVCNVLFAVVPFTGEWIPLDEGKISSIHC